jgi:GDP-mannose 6-dehydrogenase
MSLRISVFGLGYVGTVTGACFARLGHSVIGVEKNSAKAAMVRSGRSPILEPGLDAVLQEVVKAGVLSATVDAIDAVNNSDVSLISVGTYSSADGFPDLRAIYGVMDEIGDALRRKEGFHCIIIRSTVPPGTTDVAMKRIEKRSGKKCGIDFGGGMNPEFLREGIALSDFINPPFVVTGVTDKKTESMMRELYAKINAPLYCTAIHLAEILKYTCNSFHALKVAFANEVGRVCACAGVDGQELMNIFVKDRILNISDKYLQPGIPFGGSCLPKDLRGFISYAESKGVRVPLFSSILESNASHFAEIIRTIEETSVRSIGIIGVTFKEDTDDIRESPVLNLIRCLIDRGYEVKIYDHILSSRELTGTNKELFDRSIPEYNAINATSIEEAVSACELVIVTNGSYAKDKRLVDLLKSTPRFVLDLNGAFRTLIPSERYRGLCW